MIKYFSIRTHHSLAVKDVVCICMDTNYKSYRLEFNLDKWFNEDLDTFKKEICRMIDYVCTNDENLIKGAE